MPKENIVSPVKISVVISCVKKGVGKMKVLVIGGTGWVGHNIVLELAKRGHAPEIFTRRSEGHYHSAVACFPHITGNKLDEEKLTRIVIKGQYDAIIDSVPHPEPIRILSRLKDHYGRYLHCGSTGVYTPLQYLPADEKHPFATRVYEGFGGKVDSDRSAMEQMAKGNLKGTILRPCCITGPGKLPLDNLGGRRNDFIPDILQGETLDLPGEGNALLQIVHVSDLGRAFALAVEKEESCGEIINICGAEAVTLKRYCEINAEALNKKAVINLMDFEDMIAKYGEEIRSGLTFLVEHMCFHIRKAEKLLGYTPKYSIEDAVAESARLTAQEL